MKKLLQVLSFATLATLLGGCASYNHSNQYAAQANTDQVIATNVEHAFAQDKHLRHANLNATSTRGAVALSGSVASKHLRKRAVIVAQSVPGVVSVDATAVKISGYAHHKAAAKKAKAAAMKKQQTAQAGIANPAQNPATSG